MNNNLIMGAIRTLNNLCIFVNFSGEDGFCGRTPLEIAQNTNDKATQRMTVKIAKQIKLCKYLLVVLNEKADGNLALQ